MFDLSGRVALVTGGGQNVGAQICRTLAGLGAAVAVNDLSAERAGAVAASLRDAGYTAIAAPADVTDRDAVIAAVGTATGELGAVDILVNNAGIPAGGMSLTPFLETGPTDWKPFVDLNLFGVLHCTHAVLAAMVARRWGRVVTIVSDAGRLGERGQVAYSAAKAGAAAAMRSLAKEVGRDGVTCNSISLGSIARDDDPRPPELRAKQLRYYPTGRLGRPDDVAAAVAWLVSPAGEWVTGQTIPLNGGYGTS